MSKLHWFNFSWGHVESARLATLPPWYHVGGFDTAEQAAESFARCIMTQAPWVQNCSTHGKCNTQYCPHCGEETQVSAMVDNWDFAYDFFNGMYTQENDGAPSSDADDWDGCWCADWEINERPNNITLIEAFNRYLAMADISMIVVSKAQ